MTDRPRLGPPPVEPMSDAAWSRVERGVWSTLDAEAPRAPRRARRWWIAAPVALAAAAALVLVLRTDEARDDGALAPSRITSSGAPVAVSFDDAHLALDAETSLTTSREARHPLVTLERGAVWFTVAPRQQRPSFLVRAGDATVRVVGTRFRVARSAERIEVDVDRGVVEVQFRGALTQLSAQQHWSSEPPTRGAALPPAPAAPPGAAPDRDPPKVVAPAAPDAARSGTRPRIEPAHGDASRVDADRAAYEQLAGLEPRSPDAALAGYLRLAQKRGPWADPALFAAARLAVDRNDARARALLQMYLTRFPGGGNAIDARRLLERLPPR